MSLNFSELNWAGWLLLALCALNILFQPLLFGRTAEEYSFKTWIRVIIEFVLVILALKVI